MEQPRIGVYVCWCGTNIAKMVDVEAVARDIEKMENVIIAKDYKYMCSDPGQELIIKDIKENNLNRVVVSACSPRIHELTFRKALENAGLNPYLFEMANIREHVSWVHLDREQATSKAKSLVRAAVSKVNFHEPLDNLTVEINPATMVIGGGVAGLSAAITIAEAGKQVYLIEKEKQLGGLVAKLDLTFPYLYSADQLIKPMIDKVLNHKNIEVFFETSIEEIFGYIGNFEMSIPGEGKQPRELKFGNIIVATGLNTYNPENLENYSFTRLPNIVTSIDFEKRLKDGKLLTSEGKVPRHVAIIHCVGSRNKEYKEYCSRVCCLTGLKYANQIRAALPDTGIYEIYADMRAFGKGCEEFYEETSRKNIMFLMYDQQGKLPEITKARSTDNCNMLINMKEQLSGEDIEVPADMIVLMTAMESHNNAKEIAHAVGISMCGNEFYIEKHPKLDPVATTTDGVYIVGCCQGPKDIPESISQAWAASSRVLASIAVGKVEVEVTTAKVNEDLCCGCQTCISVCPYTAISFDEEKSVSVVNEVLCKGCGTCGSTCPTGAIRSRHFTDQQIMSQIEGLMLTSIPKKEILEEA